MQVTKQTAWLALGLIILSALALGIRMHKSITIVVDGETQTLDTWSWKVEQVLAQANIAVGEYDRVTPEQDNRIRDGDSIILEHAATIIVEADGEIHTLYAVDPVPAELMVQAGIMTNPGDVLVSGGQQLAMDARVESEKQTFFWQLQRSVPFTLVENGEEISLNSTAVSVGEALWQAGVTLHSTDRLEPQANTPLTSGMQVTLQRSREISIQTATNTIKMRTAANTVGEALVEAGLSLQGLDYSIPEAAQPIPVDRPVRVVRVQEEILIEQTPVPFESSYQPVADLEIDHQTVLEAGEYGIEAQRVRVRYEDGVEVSRQAEDSWLAQAPKERVIGYGTNIVMRTIETPDGPVNYWRALTVYATSYKPSDTGSNITATGKILVKGIIGVNPRYIPYGTIMYVHGYGFGEAADTGNIPARWIDLGYTDEDFVGWHQNVTVYFVWPPPEKIVWIIP